MTLHEQYYKALIAVRDAIREAEQQELESEVIATAMISLRYNLALTVEEALKDALYEWDI
ncbi:MAG: hypothetical protein ACOH2V_00545 [Candidatus Saccharimonadaceae bacterium]